MDIHRNNMFTSDIGRAVKAGIHLCEDMNTKEDIDLYCVNM